jgi:hypothetical protein
MVNHVSPGSGNARARRESALVRREKDLAKYTAIKEPDEDQKRKLGICQKDVSNIKTKLVG